MPGTSFVDQESIEDIGDCDKKLQELISHTGHLQTDS
jgi:hypothetical protein